MRSLWGPLKVVPSEVICSFDYLLFLWHGKCEEGKRESGRSRNRYTGILPYIHVLITSHQQTILFSFSLLFHPTFQKHFRLSTHAIQFHDLPPFLNTSIERKSEYGVTSGQEQHNTYLSAYNLDRALLLL